MKKLYLLILKKYKIWIISVYIFLTLIGIYVYYLMNLLDFSSVLVIAFSHFFCMYSWLNGIFTYVLPINENSDDGEVIRRWWVIFMSTFLYIYFIFSPIF